MTTKRQQRAESRMGRARDKKKWNFERFVHKVAARRLKDPKDAQYLELGFCCLPNSLEMSREEFLSKGQQLCGGAAVLFDQGELSKLLPGWGCSNRRHPAVLMTVYVESHFRDDGNSRDTRSDSFTSGGSTNWA